MAELSPDLAARLAWHQTVGAELAHRVVEKGQARARALDRERTFVSWVTLAKFYREALDELPSDEKVSASVVLLAEATRWPGRPNTTMRAVRRARPPFSLADVQLLLALDSEELVAEPDSRLEHLTIIVDRASDLSRTGEEDVGAVVADLVDRLTSWRSGLGAPDQVRSDKIRDQALALTVPEVDDPTTSPFQ